jgi:hypothetical protein
VTAPLRPPVRADGIVSTLARLLASEGFPALGKALQELAEAVGARGVALRSLPDGVLLARHDRSFHLIGDPSRPPARTLQIPVRSRGRVLALLTVTSNSQLSDPAAEVITAAADVLALVLAGVPSSYDSSAQAVLDGEADRAQLAADVDERLRESLVALRHTDPAHAAGAVTAALAAARDIVRELRATALHGGLRRALAELRGSGVAVHASEPALDRLPPAVAVVVERVAEVVVRTAVGTVQITATAGNGAVKLSAESADNAVDVSELERWARRARALGGELRYWPGGVELNLPAGPIDEGRHDHGPHL